MIDFWMDGVVSWTADRVLDILGGLLAYLTSDLFVSPDVTVLPQVQTIAARSSMVVNAAYLLAVIAAGVTLMVSDSVGSQAGVKELLPRLVVGFVASNFAVEVCAVLIEVANALTGAMVGADAPTAEAIGMTRLHVAAALTDPGTGIVALVVGLLVVLLFFTLLAGWFLRVGLLVLLAGLGPAALACYALPATQPVATLWWRALLACLGTATLQAVAFATGIHLLIEPASNLPVLLGLPGSDIVNLLLVAGVLWATVKIPGFIQRHFVRTGSTVTIGAILARTLAVQSVTRTVLRRRPTPAPRIDASTHTHHHYRRLRRVVLNGGIRP